MKILIILHYPNPSTSAAWARIGILAESLRDEGHKVFVAGVFSPKTLSKAGMVIWRGVKLINITPVISLRNVFSFIVNILSSFVTCIPIFFSILPDVTIISVPSGDTVLPAYRLAKLLRSKVVTDFRDEWEDFEINLNNPGLYRRLYETLKKTMTQCYARSDLVVSVTEAMADSLKLRGVSDVRVINNGADKRVFKPHDKFQSREKYGLNIGDFILIFSGNIGQYYRLDVVVRSLEKIKEKIQNISLLILGEGPNLDNVLELSKSIGVGKHIKYLGLEKDKAKLAEMISAADVGIVPYDSNPLWKHSIPVKALEFLACGLPIAAMAYPDSALATLIQDNDVGLASEPENVESFVTIIEALHQNLSRNDDTATKAISLVNRLFDRRKNIQEFVRLIGADT